MAATSPSQLHHSANESENRAYLFGPLVDFLLLGGGSLVALVAVRLLLGGGEYAVSTSLAATIALSNFINHPHFAHSYQIFYSDFKAKIRSTNYPRELRLRYLAIGVYAPILIALYLAWTVWAGMPRLLGLAANTMFFLVGWHYVKQGYGMAMVDAALKKRFYNDQEKKWLLLNAYATWIFSWITINYLLGSAPRKYFGLEYFTIPVPAPLLYLSAACTTVIAFKLIKTLSQRKRPFAWNGLIAYGTSIYAWLLVRDPIVLLWVPLFHSLQYLAVVWRFQLNKSRTTKSNFLGHPVGFRTRIFAFAACGVVLGYVGFWLAPGWMNEAIPYDKDLFGPSLFFFIFWIFINVHHYLIDTVMWRKGNPDVARHIFGARTTQSQPCEPQPS